MMKRGLSSMEKFGKEDSFPEDSIDKLTYEMSNIKNKRLCTTNRGDFHSDLESMLSSSRNARDQMARSNASITALMQQQQRRLSLTQQQRRLSLTNQDDLLQKVLYPNLQHDIIETMEGGVGGNHLAKVLDSLKGLDSCAPSGGADAITAPPPSFGVSGNFWMRRCDILDEEVTIWKHQVKNLNYTHSMEQHLINNQTTGLKTKIDSMKSMQSAVARQKDQRIQSLGEQLKKKKVAKIEREQLSLKHQEEIQKLKSIIDTVTIKDDSPNGNQSSKKKKTSKTTQKEKAKQCDRNDQVTAVEKNTLRNEIISLRKKQFSMFQTLQKYKEIASTLERQLAE